MLTAKQVVAAKAREKQYKMADSGGMFLLVHPNGSRYWRLKYRIDGKEKVLALGVFPDVSLAEAREKAQEARKQIGQGVDPTAAKRAEKRARIAAGEATFAKLADRWFARWSPARAAGTVVNVTRQMNHLARQIGTMPTTEIKAADLARAVEAIERERGCNPARRCLRLAREILAYGVARGDLEVNVAAGMGRILPEIRAGHRPAATNAGDVGETLRAVWGYRPGVVGQALRLLPYLFCRPGELVSMRWEDLHGLDGDKPEWRYQIPKTDTSQIVPLPRQAVEIIKGMRPLGSEWVFPATKRGHVKATTLAMAMQRYVKLDGKQTGHGWRATARTLLDEVLGFRPDWIEAQLGHVVRDANGRAYNRTTHLDGRRQMMQTWADYLDGLRDGATEKENVIPLRRAG